MGLTWSRLTLPAMDFSHSRTPDCGFGIFGSDNCNPKVVPELVCWGCIVFASWPYACIALSDSSIYGYSRGVNFAGRHAMRVLHIPPSFWKPGLCSYFGIGATRLYIAVSPPP